MDTDPYEYHPAQLRGAANSLYGAGIENKYNKIPPKLIDVYQEIPRHHHSTFNKVLLVYLVNNFSLACVSVAIPGSIESQYRDELTRIKQLIDDDTAFNYSWDNDLFVKDIAICSGRLIPIGPGLLEISGLPRKMIFSAGIRQSIDFIKVWLRLGRRSPLLINHMHLANINQFSPQGWMRAYHRVAELLEENQHIRGLMRSSWFIDPAISIISPHLRYLRHVAQQNGATILYYADEGIDSGAFSRSKSRLSLFKQGAYIPKTYYAVWPRKSLCQFLQSIDKEVSQ